MNTLHGNSTHTEGSTYEASENTTVSPRVSRAAKVIRAVNHRFRTRIIDELRLSGSMTVTDLRIKLRIEQSVMSQHLAILRLTGIVTTDRHGKLIYYTLDQERYDKIIDICYELVKGYRQI